MMHVYPHPELALIPKMLLPAFEGQRLNVGQKTVTAEQLSSVRFCAMLGSDDRAALAMQVSAVVQKICYGRIKKKPWMNARLSVRNELMLADLSFTDRALVSLQANEFFRNDGSWRSASIAEVIGPREHHQIGARLLLAFFLAAESSGSVERSTVGMQECLTLEKEIELFVQKTIHSPRTAKIFLEAHGWGGRGPMAIKDLAKELRITHERTRQIGVIAHQAMTDIKAGDGDLAMLRDALKALDTISPCLVQQANEMIAEKNYTPGVFNAEDVIGAANRFGVGTDLKVTTLDGQNFIVRQVESFHLSTLRQIARRLLRTHGILEIAELDKKCAEHFERTQANLGESRELALKANAFQAMPGWSFLDAERQWAIVTLGADGEELRPRGPVARIARLVAYFNGVKLSQAEAVLSQHGVAWPSKILLALCLKIGLRVAPLEEDWLIEAVGGQLELLKKSLHSTTEFEMAEVLKAAGGRLAKSEFIRKCERQDIHRSTVLACLKTASVFMLDTTGDYRLVNMDSPAATVTESAA